MSNFESPHLDRLRFPKRLLPVFMLIVGLVALAIRFFFWEHTIYNSDEAYLTIYSIKASHFMELAWSDVPLAGIRTSFGFRNPPFLIYLFAPIFSVSTDPRFAVFFVMLLGCSAVSLMSYTAYRLVDFLFPELDGKESNRLNPLAMLSFIIAAIIMIFAPNSVQHTRQLWGHDLIIFFSSLCYLGAVMAFIENRARWLIVSIAGVFMAQASHLSGALLWGVPFLVFLKFPSFSSKLKGIAGFFLIGLVIYGPWFVNEAGWLQESDPEFIPFESFKVFGSLISGSGNSNPVDTPVYPFVAWLGLFSDSFRLDILGELYWQTLYLNPILGSIVVLFHVISALLILGSIGYSCFCYFKAFMNNRKIEKPNEPQGLGATHFWFSILLISSLLPLFVFTVLPVSSVPLYQLPAFTSLILLVCVSISHYLTRNKKKLLKALALLVGLFALFLFCSSIHTLSVYYRMKNVDFTTPVATTLRTKLRTVWLVSELSSVGPSPEDFTVMQDGRAKDAGVDVWVGALYYVHTGERKSPISYTAPQAFVIVDNKTILREPLEEYLSDKDFTPIGTVRIYNFFGTRKQEWEELTELYPSSRP